MVSSGALSLALTFAIIALISMGSRPGCHDRDRCIPASMSLRSVSEHAIKGPPPPQSHIRDWDTRSLPIRHNSSPLLDRPVHPPYNRKMKMIFNNRREPDECIL